MIALCLYILALALAGWLLSRRSTGGAVDKTAFFVNSHRSGPASVALSIVASCVGGSATIGMAGLAWEVGVPAFWWMGSGACGLMVLTVFLARKVRRSGALTLPEMMEVSMGARARRLAAVIILLAWPAILAAQFVALGKVTAMLSGLDQNVAMTAGAVLLMAYVAFGGQAAVIRGDVIQFVVITSGLLLGLFLLGRLNPAPLASLSFEPLNTDFPPSRLVYYLAVIGGSYVVCPMLFGRFLSARDERSAQMGGWLAVAGLTALAVLVVLIGVVCRGLVPASSSPDDVLVQALGQLPAGAATLLLLALFGAVVSSADSCLVTAATVCCNDVLRLPSARACRVAVPVIGVAGLALAFTGGGILRFLLMANDVYVCGVVAPVFVALLAHPRRYVRHDRALLAVAVGGCLGLAAALTANPFWSYAGIFTSAAVCLSGVEWGTEKDRKIGEALPPQTPLAGE